MSRHSEASTSVTLDKGIPRKKFYSISSTETKENMTLRKDPKKSPDPECTLTELSHAPNEIEQTYDYI